MTEPREEAPQPDEAEYGPCPPPPYKLDQIKERGPGTTNAWTPFLLPRHSTELSAHQEYPSSPDGQYTPGCSNGWHYYMADTTLDDSL